MPDIPFEGGGTTIGTWVSIPLIKQVTWDALTYTKTEPTDCSITIDVLNSSGAAIASNVASGYDLSSITDVVIKIRANLTSESEGDTPTLDTWKVTCSDQDRFNYDDQSSTPVAIYDAVYY